MTLTSQYHPTNVWRYQPEDCRNQVSAEPRCRSCAKVFCWDSRMLTIGDLCGHTTCVQYSTIDPAFPSLVSLCRRLQADFKSYCEERQPVKTWSQGDMPASQYWWWDMVNIFQQQCHMSLVEIAPRLEALLEQNWSSGKCASYLHKTSGIVLTTTTDKGGPIRQIWEIKIVPTKYYYYQHCAFAVELAHDGWWVFDPTGVQFGPVWALLSPLDIYIARSESKDPARIAMRRSAPLGTSAQLVRDGQPPF